MKEMKIKKWYGTETLLLPANKLESEYLIQTKMIHAWRTTINALFYLGLCGLTVFFLALTLWIKLKLVML